MNNIQKQTIEKQKKTKTTKETKKNIIPRKIEITIILKI